MKNFYRIGRDFSVSLIADVSYKGNSVKIFQIYRDSSNARVFDFSPSDDDVVSSR